MFKKKKKNSVNIMGDKRAKIFYACVIALPILNFLIMWLGVNFNSFLLAFQKYDFAKSLEADDTVYVWNGWNNIKRVWNDFTYDGGILRIALKNSLIHYIVPTAVGATVGLWASYYIAKKYWGGEFFKALGVAVSTVSGFIMCLLWLHFCTNAYPAFVQNLFGIKVEGLMSNTSTVTFAILLFPCLTIGTSLIYISVMSRIPSSCIEAAKLDGITPMQEFRYITFPLISPTFFMYFATGIPAIFTGQGNLYNYFGEFADPSVQTIGYVLFIKVAGSKASIAEYPYAAAAGMVCTFVCVPITVLARWLIKKYTPDVAY